MVRGRDGGAGEAGTWAESDQEDRSDALLRRFLEVRLELGIETRNERKKVVNDLG